MSDTPKSPNDLPPLADKGDARPLSHGRTAQRPEDEADAEKRPSGLHTRPDLFGSSAVMQRPDETADAEKPDAAPEQAGEDRSLEDQAAKTPVRAAPRTTPVGVFLPVANLQDQPLRIPDSIAFEDWPDGEPEAGARSPEGASLAAAEPEAAEPAKIDLAASQAADPDLGAFQTDDLAVPEKPAEAASPPDWQSPNPRTPDWQTPNRQPDPSAGPDRIHDLLARLETGINLQRLSRLKDARWLLPTGIAACAALLVVGLAVGLIPIPGEESQQAQMAENLEQPAVDEPEFSAPISDQQDLQVMPAASDLGDAPAETALPAASEPAGEPATDMANDPAASQLAALPEPGAPSALDAEREPIVDFMRIDPDGKAVVAGRAAPGTELTVLDNGEPLGTVTADIYGLWTFVSADPLTSGRHEIGLRVDNQGSEISSEPVLVTESGAATMEEPDRADGLEDRQAAATEEPDFSRDLSDEFEAPEQLAAAAPERPVRSDVSALQEPAEGAQEPTPEPAPSGQDTAEAGATIETAAGATEQTAELAAEEPAEPIAEPAAEPVTATAPAPEPKPEPPAETQIAKAVPTSGDFVIQFASFLNPETAAREQGVLEEDYPDLLTGHRVFVQQVDIADQGTFYRVRVGSFASLDEARATCSRFQERERDCLAMAR